MYLTLTDLSALIPPEFLTQSLDDDADGIIDAWDAVSTAACDEVDAILGVRYAVPLPAPYPAIAIHSARVLAAEACYLRRGAFGERNPFSVPADAIRKTLRSIAAGTLPLDPTIKRPAPTVSIITEPSRTAGERTSV